MNNRVKIIIGLVIIMAGLLVILFFQSGQDTIRIIYFNVGQGDSILIDAPEDFQILIDGGPNDTVVEKLGEYMPFYDRTIELMILTHPHADHVNGLVEVLKRYKVKHVLHNYVEYKNSAYERWLELIEEQGIDSTVAVSGLKYSIAGGIELSTLYPFTSYEGQEVDDLNSSSVVNLLKYNDASFLFTGDITGDKELEILERGINVSANVLKVAHHGSKDSSIDEFIEAVRPEIAVIQVGADNKFGHPGARVIGLLEEMGIKTFRNDLDGDVVLESDGQDIWQK
ncbi:MBL fold metallo-hydrolase [Patescibacteria group bacterium]|nr:MBL fold metallo-hydrolase [Patescibacteria group bacterium]MBU1890374.1 MBL fold metallo-hydrolase [Patescibacteria group bacterium]